MKTQYSMRNIILSLATIFFVVNLSAQDTRQMDEQTYQAFLEEQITAMELTEEQRDEFILISDKYRAKVDELRIQDISRFSKLKKVKGLMKEKDKEVKALVNEDQYETYLSLRKEKRKSRGGGF